MRRAALVLASGLLSLASAAAADPAAKRVGKPDAELSGKDVYQCVVDNRFRSYIQDAKLVSGDRGAATQESRLQMTWSSFRDEQDQPVAGVLSKTIVRYTDPFDLRYSGYLVVNNDVRPNDQFVYLNARRKVRRVNLREEAVFGTDFTFEDIVPNEVEDGDYQRLPDQELAGKNVYVVEVIPKPEENSEYSKFVIHVDKSRCVPLLTRYWDEKGVEVKQLTVVADKIQDVSGVHWPMELTMRNLQLESFTTLLVEKLEPNPKLERRDFDLRRLESH
jgi:Outer membrane lipoprotein-sorting protein